MFKSLYWIICSLFMVSACVQQGGDWNTGYGETPPGAPSELYGTFSPDMTETSMIDGTSASAIAQETANVKTIAVLLPLSGPNAELGEGLRHAIEIAFLQKQPKNILISFNDLSGTQNNKISAIEGVLLKKPDIIIGPIFAEDATLLRNMKPDELPVLSFSSDQSALGDGVLSVALMPNQGAEASVEKIVKDGRKKILVLAPNNNSGYVMATTALDAVNIYSNNSKCLIYYTEGDSDSIKSAASRAAQYPARNAANDRAKEILSDILINENLSASEKNSLNAQLERLSKNDTLGNPPFDSVLFLGGAADSKSLASFLKYYDIGDAKLYGTAMWDSPIMLGDIQMFGSEYSSLPPVNPNFEAIYTEVEGKTPSRMDSFAYDATMLAIGAIESHKGIAAYLLDPSGYRGLDGLLRLRPNGESERALQINRLNSDGAITVVGPAQNFIHPLYQTPRASKSKPNERSCDFEGVRATDYINIPARLRTKYTSKLYGSWTKLDQTNTISDPVTVLPEDDSEPVYTDPDFQPTNLDEVDKHMIDEVSVTN